MILNAYLIKIYMNIMEFLGRIFVLNRNMPSGCRRVYNIRYSKKGLLDVILPENSKGRLPALIYLHGGGWVTGSRRTCRRLCCVFAGEGYAVINIKYRLAPLYRHPGALEDIGKVISWLNNHKEEYNLDASRIFIGGSSAGAHLACMSACIASNPELRNKMDIEFPIEASQIAGLLLIYGGYNLRTIVDSGFFMIKSMVRAYTGSHKPDDSEIWNQVSPVDHINSQFPPAFIAVGKRDHLYGQSLEFIGLLDKYNLPYESLLFDSDVRDATHGFFHFYKRECTKKTYRAIIEFMKQKAGFS